MRAHPPSVQDFVGDDELHLCGIATDSLPVDVGVSSQNSICVAVGVRAADPENVRLVFLVLAKVRPGCLAVGEMDMDFVFGNVFGGKRLRNVGTEQDAVPPGQCGVDVAQSGDGCPAFRSARRAVDAQGLLRPEIDEDQVAPAIMIMLFLEGAEETDHLCRGGTAVPAVTISPASGADQDRLAIGPGFKVAGARPFVCEGRADPELAAALRTADLGRQGLG